MLIKRLLYSVMWRCCGNLKGITPSESFLETSSFLDYNNVSGIPLLLSCTYSVTQKISHPLWPAVFWHFSQTVENFKCFFTHLLYVPIYARLQIFIELSQILRNLCHIKRDYLVHVIYSKCPIGRNTRVQTFAKVVDSFVDRCLWQVIPDLLLL